MTMTQPANAIDIIERLVAIDTTSRNSNLGLIETVRDDLARQGLDPWLTYDAGGGKANLFVTIPDADGGTTGGTVLSGHTDVVPVDGQDWSTDPFVPTTRDGRMYGRGTADMKGFIGTALALVPEIIASRLDAPMHLALSFDEEVGCLGAPLMIDEIVRRGIAPGGCVVGEPTEMGVIVGHKGVNIHRCEFHGRAAHSSLTDQGVNAIEYAARLIVFVRDLADRWRQSGPRDAAFDTPYATAQTGLIRGGSATNIVPDHCEVSFEFRNLPGDDAARIFASIRDYARDTLEAAMKREWPEARVEFETLACAPAMSADEQAAISRLIRTLARDDRVAKVAYGTEGGQFQAAGIPTIICGPGNIRHAHRPDEYVELDQIARCEDFLRQLVASQVRQ
jgi:acetylornithine deacetylase